MTNVTWFYNKTVIKLSEIQQIEKDTKTILTRRQDKDGTQKVSFEDNWVEIVKEDLTKL